jgi:hypothetical protein
MTKITDPCPNSRDEPTSKKGGEKSDPENAPDIEDVIRQSNFNAQTVLHIRGLIARLKVIETQRPLMNNLDGRATVLKNISFKARELQTALEAVDLESYWPLYVGLCDVANNAAIGSKEEFVGLTAQKVERSATGDEALAESLRAAAVHVDEMRATYLQCAKDLDAAAINKRRLTAMTPPSATAAAEEWDKANPEAEPNPLEPPQPNWLEIMVRMLNQLASATSQLGHEVNEAALKVAASREKARKPGKKASKGGAVRVRQHYAAVLEGLFRVVKSDPKYTPRSTSFEELCASVFQAAQVPQTIESAMKEWRSAETRKVVTEKRRERERLLAGFEAEVTAYQQESAPKAREKKRS